MKSDAEKLVAQFQRMVGSDGSTLDLVEVADGVIRVAYRPGSDPDCSDGACVMPHLELEQLMNETLSRRATGLRVAVERASAAGPGGGHDG